VTFATSREAYDAYRADGAFTLRATAWAVKGRAG
jgi:hypothetical protein